MEADRYFLSELITIGETPARGRGIFAVQALPAGVLLETSPVIVMSSRERSLLDQTALHDYIFIWGEAEDQCCMAMGYVPLYNHASPANCDYEMDFENGTISIVTLRDIEAGAELFINYNGAWDDAKPVWFTPCPPEGGT